jgi:hypothetical protein
MKRKDIIKSIIFIIFVVGCLIIINKFTQSSNAMVIVEPRAHPLLKGVIENFDKNMDKSWDMYVFHGKSQGAFAKQATASISGRRVYLLPLDTDNLNADGYNSLFKKPSFWNKVHAEHILVFQTDTVLCGKSMNKINNFLKYPYIGCPFDDKRVGDHPVIENYPFYGIGGLSFRKKSFMMDCIKRHPNVEDTYAEDVFFSKCVKDEGNKENVTVDVLNNFCTQHIYAKDSFGAHKVNVDLKNKIEKKEFYSFCPEATLLETS